MKRIRSLLTTPEFILAAFFLFLLLFNWPYLSLMHERPDITFFFIFGVWALLIILLFLIAHSLGSNSNSDKKAPHA